MADTYPGWIRRRRFRLLHMGQIAEGDARKRLPPIRQIVLPVYPADPPSRSGRVLN